MDYSMLVALETKQVEKVPRRETGIFNSLSQFSKKKLTTGGLPMPKIAMAESLQFNFLPDLK
jgi:hypothetical protein